MSQKYHRCIQYIPQIGMFWTIVGIVNKYDHEMLYYWNVYVDSDISVIF